LIGFIQHYNSTSNEAIKTEFKDFHFVKIFASCFLVVFLINALFVVLNEKDQWDKLNRLRYFFQKSGERLQVSMFWMYVGCFVNNWVVFWCSLDVLLVCSSATTVQDVLFDALSLLFLYNLDDIGGDLGFFSEEDWKGQELAWVYSYLQNFIRSYPDDTCSWNKVRLKKNLFADVVNTFTICWVVFALFVFPVLHFLVPVITLTGIEASDKFAMSEN